MSKYSSSQVQTQYIDPVAFVPNGRCRFELDATKAAYLPNMRILNLGCNSDAVTQYNRGLGALALIKNIRLLDAHTVLSSLREVAPYMFFKSCNASNSENKSHKSWTRRNDLGLELDSTTNKLGNIYNSGTANLGTAGNESDTAILDLRLVFPILNELSSIPTSIFKNLVVEIEFQSSPANQVLVNVGSSVTILRPVLAVDYMDNMNLVAPLTQELISNGANWLEVEHDNYVIPAVDTTAYAAADIVEVQSNNNSLGFIGKSLERLLITKQIGDKEQELNSNAVLGYSATASSQALLNAEFQIRLNGRAIMPGNCGVKGNNARLGYMVDTWGDLSLNPSAVQYKWDQTASILNASHEGGQQDFIGVMIGARVQDLQISISRDTVNDTSSKHPTSSQLQVNMYGEVRKVLSIRADGSYIVVYA